MGKITTSDTKTKQRHNPLLKDISSQGGNLRTVPRSSSSSSQKKKSSKKQRHNDEDDEESGGGEGFLDASSSRKILQLAKEQQDELEQEDEIQNKPSFAQSFKNQQIDSEEEEEEDEYSDFEEEEEVEEIVYDEEDAEVDPKDAELFNKYFQSNGENNNNNNDDDSFQPTINLADKILAKIQEKEFQEFQKQQQQQQSSPDNSNENAVLLPPKVILAYEKIGQILSTYTHGKLPKLFKILPSLKNWQDVLYVTNPNSWTPHATYEATKLFVSNLSSNEATVFIETILLPRFRDSIENSDDHSLNYHIYRALKKSLYKPGAFFKGFLLPLVDGYCSVREATIAASVLTKVSVPVLHSSVALTQLLTRDFNPATTVFIRVLIEKKYALPYQTLDELVFYFMRFRNATINQDENMENMDIDQEKTTKVNNGPQLPVVWHKAFLSFATRYKNDLTDDQKDFLLETVRQRFHPLIGPEIRRELLS
ncbi:essential nuclear protein 1 [Candida albicans P57072]|uniref:Essential nuclear protein 1 n=1 Tax=Candida albicans P78048 TaxID=1094989 RepID=A0AB34PN39_CANAX|nr:essential nuclear protein 1 [Candida albicans P37005]KGR02449.1 essential nuclear protein 1 [Candida albicans P57072]KGR04692.1 essential nuclear protein 1 [Candida albicans P78048]KGU03882.1 essential nuclear protein 1 [Candida albicans L26]KHC30389.1 essential nuclear protein 1 [Candida albicans P76055]